MATLTIRQGESLPVYAPVTYKIGATHTIQAIPAPVVTVYDAYGQAITGYIDIPATGYDTTAKQMVRAWWTPTSAFTATNEPGEYTVNFTFSTVDTVAGEGLTRTYRPQIPFILAEDEPALPVEFDAGLYPGPAKWVRLLLQDSVGRNELAAAVRPNSEFELATSAIIRELFAPYAETYDSLTGDDLENADETIGLFASAFLLVPLSTGGGASPLVYDNITTAGDTKITRQFAQIGGGAASIDERNAWRTRAWSTWARVSFVAAVRQTAPSPALFGVVGRRRSLETGYRCR